MVIVNHKTNKKSKGKEKFEPRVNVLNIGTTFRGNTLNVTLEFAVINDPRPQELTLALERVR